MFERYDPPGLPDASAQTLERVKARAAARHRNRRRLFAATGALVVLGGVGVAFGVTASHAPTRVRTAGRPPATEQPSSTLPLSPSSTTATTTASSGRPGPAGGPGRCHTTMLSASLTNFQGAAGTMYSHLLFRNTSSVTCVMSGYPGVSFVDSGGHQIGSPVPRLTGYGGSVALVPGAVGGAVFALHTVYVETVPNCQPTPAAGLRIYPPGETAALFVPDAVSACADPSTPDSASIGAVTALSNLPG